MSRLCDDDGTVRAGRPFHHGTDYPCTGTAHAHGAHIECSNPVHRQTDYRSTYGPVFANPVDRCVYDREEALRRYQSENDWWDKRLAGKRQTVTFDELLNDPTQQLDRDGVVLDSVLRHIGGEDGAP